MFIPLQSLSSPVDFSTQILILPSISKGNVPQLACDLLIASLNLHHVGYLDSKDLVPVVGGRERGERGVSTPIEVFSSRESPITVVLQRSPVLKAYKGDFVKEIMDWIKTANFKSLVLLAGMDTTSRTDSQMQSPYYYYTPPSSPSLPSEISNNLDILPVYQPAPLPDYLQTEAAKAKEGEGDTVPFIPGGGLTRRMLSSIGPEWKIPTLAILQFVMEGDNRGDSGMQVALLNRLLQLHIQSIKEPESWKQGLFGSTHDGSLFG
ncbi:hypothetical protein FRC19_005037 [Serendipita sp. 401]|nr:hypothetical protein FRC19_005037 [Serendipita sp. 401]